MRKRLQGDSHNKEVWLLRISRRSPKKSRLCGMHQPTFPAVLLPRNFAFLFQSRFSSENASRTIVMISTDPNSLSYRFYNASLMRRLRAKFPWRKQHRTGDNAPSHAGAGEQGWYDKD